MNDQVFAFLETPIGTIGITEENGYITKITLPNDLFDTYDFVLKDSREIFKAKKQLEEYFDGQRKEFNFKFKQSGTMFRQKVWNQLLNIPYGKTCSYKEVAIAIGKPLACRAVGQANNKNDLPIIVPCHRVIGSNNSYVGYAGGIDIKKYLINLEKHNI